MKSSARYMGQIMTHIGTFWGKQSTPSAIAAPPDTPIRRESPVKYELLARTRAQRTHRPCAAIGSTFPALHKLMSCMAAPGNHWPAPARPAQAAALARAQSG